MAGLAARVGSALELVAARETTADLLEPAGLVLEHLLAADAWLLDEEGALGAVDVVGMAVVLHRGVAAGRLDRTVETAFWRPCAAGLGRLQDRPAAPAADLLEHGLEAAGAGASVADLLALVGAALEGPATDADANVLGLDLVRDVAPVLLLGGGLSLDGPPLARAAALATLMAPAVQLRLANLHTDGMFHIPTVAQRPAYGTSASTADVLILVTGRARADVACLCTSMATSHDLAAGLLAMRYFVLTCLSRVVEQLVKRRLAAWAVQDDIRR